jgi:hypothetical protein
LRSWRPTYHDQTKGPPVTSTRPLEALGPLVAGVLLDAASPRVTIATFAAFGLALAVWGTLSPSVRKAPRLDELDRLARDTLSGEAS